MVYSSDTFHSLGSLYGHGRPVFSVEFFPPKTEEGLSSAKDLISTFATLPVDFMTVTYGAGGSTRTFTRNLVSFIHAVLKIRAVAHLTCVGHSVDEINEIVSDLRQEGIRDFLALRGDVAGGTNVFEPHPEGFSCARDLIKHLRAIENVSLLAAAYPEGHKDARDVDSEYEYLKEKIDAGAEIVLTQLFFDNDLFFRFRDRALRKGITVPLIPGIMPIRDVSQLERFTQLCGATIPASLRRDLETIRGDKSAVIRFGTDFCISQYERLLSEGVQGVHLYTLNKSNQASEILRAIAPQ